MIQTSPRFLICIPFTLTEEGGDSKDAHDPGGRTHKGIIQREYDRYRRLKGLPLQSDYLMSDDEVFDIYFNEYWLPHCPSLAPGVDLSYFDNCVNEGPRRANILLQRALGVTDDGVFGDGTAKAVAAADPKTIIIKMTAARHAFYRALSTYQYFHKGWDRRTDEIGAASLKMVAA
jgi:lysozyme family protein